ncbi:arsenical resistance operon transcriptional repressor ArsD [bacterium]|nr:MAG: arsenical resistance operon transcriptional repressor ArsD [bacterium]
MTMIKIFMLSQHGGPVTCACGGSFGQSEEQIQVLQYALEEAFDCQVEVYDISRRGDMRREHIVFDLMSRSGVKALPIVVVNDEVVSTGKVNPEYVIAAIKAKLAA